MAEGVRRDAPRVTVSFTGHRLVDPRGSEAELRRQLNRRAFDHLLSLAMARIGELSVERAELQREHDLLRPKLWALERGGWGFEQTPEAPPDAAALIAELDGIAAELEVLGSDPDVLKSHLAMVAGLLTEAEHQLWTERTALDLDAMSVARDADDPAGRRIVLQELHNANGQRVVMLPLSFVPEGSRSRI